MKLSYICPMFSGLSRFSLIAVVSFLLLSCSGFNKVLKSTDNEYRLKMAEQYYSEGKYEYSRLLLEDLIAIYRGTAKSEKVFYLFAMSYYHQRDYFTAGIYLKNFTKTFPKSSFAEESAYLAAMCAYYQSPKSSLDQTDTYLAMNDFQLFLNRYPESSKKDTVNLMMTQLRTKLEKKAFDISKLYYQTERYKAAVVSLNNTIRDYPNTRYEEEILFMILRANYQLALNSIESKKRERLDEATKAYERYIDRYASSRRAGDAETLYRNIQSEIQKLNKQSISL